MSRIENDGIKRVSNYTQPKIEPKPKTKVEIQTFNNSSARKGEVRFHEQQQHDRIES